MYRWRLFTMIAAIAGALVLLVLAGFTSIEKRLRTRATPPAQVTTLANWMKWQATAEDFYLGPSETHLTALGRSATLLPSGPSAYVFDASGQLVDWTADIGDDLTFGTKWPQKKPIRFLNRTEAVAWATRMQESPE